MSTPRAAFAEFLGTLLLVATVGSGIAAVRLTDDAALQLLINALITGSALVAQERSGTGLLLGEVVATFGLLLVVFGVVRSGRDSHVAYAVGGYITAAYWFTSSTSFANPAVTVARTLSDTFAGIAPASVAPSC